MYFLGGVPDPITFLSTAIKYARVPPPKDADWEHIELGKPVVDFATAIEEHDLIAVVTYWFSVDIVLLDLSTQKHHLLATQPIIHVQDVEARRQDPHTTIEIAGDNIFLVIQYPAHDETDLDTLHIYEWKSGIAQMDPAAVSNIGSAFLAEDTILVPNGKDKSLDVYHIPSDGKAKKAHRIVLEADAPRSAAPSWNRRRYTSGAEDSLLFVIFETMGNDGEDPDDGVDEFVFVVHRTALLQVLRNRQKKNKSTTPCRVWGPIITRWLDTVTMGTGLLNMSHGQRFVWLAHDAAQTPAPIHVLDFTARAVGLRMANQTQPNPPTATMRLVEMTDPTIIDHPAFLFPVRSHLPYVETVSTATFDYGAVAVNEENILGIKFADSPDMVLKSIDVLHFG
ncbi:hypothetical protein C8R44DRAFT_883735 [Mycena epipterygia]|nr:hypothetical protein C8R44DRAFT_883735 [Mycena epipterygia]